MFENYKDNLKPDLILAQGMERFCQDLGLNPDQFEMLALAWKFNADRMCCFTRLNIRQSSIVVIWLTFIICYHLSAFFNTLND